MCPSDTTYSFFVVSPASDFPSSFLRPISLGVLAATIGDVVNLPHRMVRKACSGLTVEHFVFLIFVDRILRILKRGGASSVLGQCPLSPGTARPKASPLRCQ